MTYILHKFIEDTADVVTLNCLSYCCFLNSQVISIKHFEIDRQNVASSLKTDVSANVRRRLVLKERTEYASKFFTFGQFTCCKH